MSKYSIHCTRTKDGEVDCALMCPDSTAITHFKLLWLTMNSVSSDDIAILILTIENKSGVEQFLAKNVDSFENINELRYIDENGVISQFKIFPKKLLSMKDKFVAFGKTVDTVPGISLVGNIGPLNQEYYYKLVGNYSLNPEPIFINSLIDSFFCLSYHKGYMIPNFFEQFFKTYKYFNLSFFDKNEKTRDLIGFATVPFVSKSFDTLPMVKNPSIDICLIGLEGGEYTVRCQRGFNKRANSIEYSITLNSNDDSLKDILTVKSLSFHKTLPSFRSSDSEVKMMDFINDI